MPGLIDDSLNAGNLAYTGLEDATEQAKNQFIQDLQLKAQAKNRIRGLVGTVADTAGRYAPRIQDFFDPQPTPEPATPATTSASEITFGGDPPVEALFPSSSSAPQIPGELPSPSPADYLVVRNKVPNGTKDVVAVPQGLAAAAAPPPAPAPSARYRSALLGTILKEVGHGLTGMFGGHYQ